MSDDPLAQPNSGTDLIWRTVVEFKLPATDDNAGHVVNQMIAVVAEFGLSPARLEQLTRATAEAIHNAALQNSRLRLELPVQIRVSVATPADRDTACCWGFFVIARTADPLSATGDPAHHTIELYLYQESTQPRKTAA
jgi:hypothetical protein